MDIVALLDLILMLLAIFMVGATGIWLGWVSATETTKFCKNCKRKTTFGYNVIQKRCKCGKILTRKDGE